MELLTIRNGISMKILHIVIFFCLFFVGEIQAHCIGTNVTQGDKTWKGLVCTRSTSGFTAFLQHINKNEPISVSTGRAGDGQQRFGQLNRDQKCSIIEANKPENCDARPIESSYGCSGPNGLTGYGEASFLNACYSHDACYDMFGSSKSVCDSTFRNEMEKSCENSYPVSIPGEKNFPAGRNSFQQHACKGAAGVFHSAVVSWGGTFFSQAQEAAMCNKYLNLHDRYCS